MKKIITIVTITIALTLAITITAAAQTSRQLKVYLKGGLVDKVQVDADASISHSRADLNGTVHDDYVSMVITDALGRNRQYLISQLDSLVLPNGRRVVFHGFINENQNENENRNENVNENRNGAGSSQAKRPGAIARSQKRTSFDGTFPGGSGVTYYWTYNDHIRLDVGYESRAKSLSNNNTEASFVFEDADLDAESYMVYFPDREVTIPSVQTQTGANTTAHIGASGDCGTGIATRDEQSGNYNFLLTHHAAYLCFLPHIDYLPSVRLDKIVVSCTSGIAGTFEQSLSGLYNGTNTSNTITLNLIPQNDIDFIIGHNIHTEQDSCAAYMVIAPQSTERTFTVSYHVTDTLSRVKRIYWQTFSFRPLANTVYPITFSIKDKDFRVVDLGLSVNWANVNLDADEPSQQGTFYENDADANAAFLEKTTVTEWLMPDADQREEILEKCLWTRSNYNGRPGFLVTGASASKEDGNVHRIFIPCPEGCTPDECLSQNNRPIEALMVDLGLNVKWASRNIGANSVEEHGDYFAWGETDTKDDYTSGTYLYGTRNLGNACDISGTNHDAAVVKWGGIWRTPKLSEMQELLSDCEWSWSNINGVNGYVVEGPNGNRIFLPCTGVMKGRSVDYVNSGAGYQISLSVLDSWNAYTLSWYLTTKNIYSTNTSYEPFPYNNGNNYNILVARYFGRTIRPVAAPNAMAPDGTMLNIVTDSAAWKLGDISASLYGTLSSSTPIKGSVKVGIIVGDSVTIVKGRGRFENEIEVAVAGSFSYTVPVYDNIGYWYRAYVATADTIFYGEVRHYGYEMVDLGLSIQWANMNLGADAPEDNGYYYAWGETKPKTVYSSGTYAFGTTQNLGDEYNIAGTELDAAHVNMGNSWRMPTKKELNELIDSCDWLWTTQNSVNGYLVSSRKNDNSIFLPAAGIMKGGDLVYENSGASYPSSSGEENSQYVHSFAGYLTSWRKSSGNEYDPYPYNNGNNYGLSSLRYYGHTIRAVAASNAVSGDSVVMNIRTDSVTWKLNDTSATLYATVSSNTPVTDVKVGFVVGDSATIVKGKARFDYPQILAAAGRFSYTLSVYENFGYWFRAYVEAGDTVFYGKAMHFGLEMVDLGLPSGTLWANMNVGAGLPEEYGGYYAWGETNEKDDYSLDSYSHYSVADGWYKNLGEHFDIGGGNLDPAHVIMGSVWRLPTSIQLQELVNKSYTTWKWTSQNSVEGYVVTSLKNGRSIFLPAAGVKRGTNHEFVRQGAVYMGSTQADHHYSSYNYNIAFYTRGYGCYNHNTYDPFPYSNGSNYGVPSLRYLGRSVRAVAAPNAITHDGKMFIVLTDSSTWKMGVDSARIYGSFGSTEPIEGSVKVGFVIGDSSTIVKGRAKYEYEEKVTQIGTWSTTVKNLHDDLGYWYRAFLEVGDTVFYAQARHFGREMVDLGLPSGTLWSNMDVGAKTPDEYGYFFAWGETSPKTSYTLENYQYYNEGSYLSIGNNGDIKGTAFDAASVILGSQWCMPTDAEIRELVNGSYTTWEWSTQNSVSGYRVTGRNDNSIFLPSAGMMKDDNRVYTAYSASYHSSVMNNSERQFESALSWYGYSGSRNVYNYNAYDPYPYQNGSNYGISTLRYWGRLIRPVATRKAGE